LAFFFILTKSLSFVKKKQEDCCMRIVIGMIAVTAALLAGCVSGEKKAADLLDTARFEEKQNNFEHAAQLYEEILKKFPDTPAAKEASARASVLNNQKKP
jgi:outer membrane murein-binding lipoprotein Lpp